MQHQGIGEVGEKETEERKAPRVWFFFCGFLSSLVPLQKGRWDGSISFPDGIEDQKREREMEKRWYSMV